jgi:hypothetical protein
MKSSIKSPLISPMDLTVHPAPEYRMQLKIVPLTLQQKQAYQIKF